MKIESEEQYNAMLLEQLQVRDDDLKELAYSAYEEAMAFGLSPDSFLRYFKTVRNRTFKKP